MNSEDRIIELLSAVQTDLSEIRSTLAEIRGDLAEAKGTLASHTEKLNALVEWTRNVPEVVRVPSAKYYRENRSKPEHPE